MITIDIYPNSYSINGHANYAEEGSDIVCAAVSATAQVTANILSNITETSVDAHKGSLSVQVHRQTIYTQFVLKAFTDAVRDLEGQYRENIKVEMNIG